MQLADKITLGILALIAVGVVFANPGINTLITGFGNFSTATTNALTGVQPISGAASVGTAMSIPKIGS